MLLYVLPVLNIPFLIHDRTMTCPCYQEMKAWSSRGNAPSPVSYEQLSLLTERNIQW